jgi:hypothetical protein
MVGDLGCCPQSCPQIQVARLLTLFAIFGSTLPENHECSSGTSGDLVSGPRKWSEDLLGPVGRHHSGNLHLHACAVDLRVNQNLSASIGSGRQHMLATVSMC